MEKPYTVYRRDSENWNMAQYHFHEQYEILLSLSENADMFVTDQCYSLHRGSLILLPPSVLHRSVAEEDRDYNRYVMRFTEGFARSLSTGMTNLLRPFSTRRIQYQLDEAQTRRLSDYYEACIAPSDGFGADLRAQVAFINLLLYVEELTSCHQSEPASRPGQFPSYVSELLRYIPGHLQEDLSLDTLAARCFISKTQLCRAFKNATGFALGDYIIQTRVLRACSLLQRGHRVQDAGEAAGFHSDSHFIRTFRSVMGIPPGKYRQAAEEAKP